jgi:transcription initiation factor TFIID subunit 5
LCVSVHNHNCQLDTHCFESLSTMNNPDSMQDDETNTTETAATKNSPTNNNNNNSEKNVESSKAEITESISNSDPVNEEDEEEKKKRQQEQQVELIVLKYLKQKGYTKALDALKSERGESEISSLENLIVDIERDVALTSNDKEVLNDYLDTSNIQRSNSRRYLHAYQSLTDWVYSSLDIYKNELIQVLYPVFVHCYLELVLKGFKDEARKFLSKYKSQHTHFHYEEILILQSLTSPDLVAQNEFAQRVLNHKFIIRLSQASFELLMKFLQDSELNLLAILNRFVNFKVYKGQPSINAPIIEDGILQLDTGIKKSKMRRDQKRKRSEEGEEEEESEIDDYNLYLGLTARQKAIRWETTVEENELVQKLNGGAALTKEPGKRGRKKKAFVEAEKQMKQLAETASKTCPTLPSVCFYTMFNCKDELNTLEIAVPKSKKSSTFMDFDSDRFGGFDVTNGPIIAGGYSDSTIKCWNWNLISHRNSMSVNRDTSDNMDLNSDLVDSVSSNYLGRRKKAQDVDYQTLVGHFGPVYSLSFSSDQRWLLSGSEDSTVRLWNVETSSNIVVYKGHQYAIWDVCFSPLDYIFASASHDRTARIWVTDRVTPVRILAGHLSDVECVKFHPNSKYIATGSNDKTVRLWDVDTGECVRLFRGHHDSIHALAFSKDGRYCASAGHDQQIFVWDIANGRQVYKFTGHTDQISSLDFNYTGTLLASSSLDCTVRLWDITKGEVFSSVIGAKGSTGEFGPSRDANTVKRIVEEEESQKAVERKPLKTFYTKQTPVYKLVYLQKDVILAGGCFSLL